MNEYTRQRLESMRASSIKMGEMYRGDAEEHRQLIRNLEHAIAQAEQAAARADAGAEDLGAILEGRQP